MKCEICGKGPQDGVTVFRQNPKGEKGIWHCAEHNAAKVDSEVVAVVEVLESA